MERKFIRESITKAAEEVGYLAMKAEQVDIVMAFVVFAVFPTGFGKSLCYACLSIAFNKMLKEERGYQLQ